jgi:hypothetical protein
VDGVGIVRDTDAADGQLSSKSYRAGAGDRRRGSQSRQPLRELLGPGDERVPAAGAVGRVERREDLAAEAVEDGQPLALAPGPGPDPAPERVEGADPARRQPEAGGQPARGGDADPQPRERARPEADGEQLDRVPAAGGGGRRRDLGEQRRRVPRPAGRREAELGGVQDLAVAPGADGGVDGRGVEADDDQSGSPASAR